MAAREDLKMRLTRLRGADGPAGADRAERPGGAADGRGGHPSNAGGGAGRGGGVRRLRPFGVAMVGGIRHRTVRRATLLGADSAI